MRTLFVEAYIKEDFTPLLKEILSKVSEKKIGLVTTVQHIRHVKFIKDYLTENWRKVYRQEELKNLEGFEYDHNESGFDLLEPISGLRIQVKYRGGCNIHLEQTRRSSTKNSGEASKSGHVLYSSGEFDVLLAVRPKEFRYEFVPSEDLVIIPEHELINRDNKKFLIKSVGLVLERKLRKKYTNIVEVLNNLIEKEEK